MEPTEDIKIKILEAAESRFFHYGFKKTTMAEIAKDCDMSAANIYRFFKNKEEICVELTQIFFKQIESSLREIVRKQEIPVSEKLEEFILKIYKSKSDLYRNSPKINELIEYIQYEQSEILDKFFQIRSSMISEILSEGNRSGEFLVEDVISTAKLILKSTEALFYCLMLNSSECTAIDEHDPKNMIHLIINGLKKR